MVNEGLTVPALINSVGKKGKKKILLYRMIR